MAKKIVMNHEGTISIDDVLSLGGSGRVAAISPSGNLWIDSADVGTLISMGEKNCFSIDIVTTAGWTAWFFYDIDEFKEFVRENL